MKSELNEYLFYEFGVEGDATRVSDTWPFALREAAVIDGEYFFEFETDGEPYYAIHGSSLRFCGKDGTLEDMKFQERGSRWIGHRQPVDLTTSRGEHPAVPMIPERRARIAELARQIRPDVEVNIREGLFLETTREYLALVEFPGDEALHVVGDRILIKGIPRSSLSGWKTLSRAVGRYLDARPLE